MTLIITEEGFRGANQAGCSVAMMQAWIAGLHQKTGRTLDEWIDLVQEEGPEPEPERRAWLKAKHGMGTNASWWIAQRAEGKGMEDGDPEAYLKAAEGYVEASEPGSGRSLRRSSRWPAGWALT